MRPWFIRKLNLKFSLNPFKSLKTRTGFSLVEIMIVLAIVGTIIGMISQRIMGAGQKAKAKEAKIAMNNIGDALSEYYNDCGHYPKALKGLVEPDPECSNWTDVYYRGKLVDSWNNEYVYELNGSEFVLKSLGADKREGGTSYNKDLIYGDETSGEKKE